MRFVHMRANPFSVKLKAFDKAKQEFIAKNHTTRTVNPQRNLKRYPSLHPGMDTRAPIKLYSNVL
jgi:hypothetical protein